MHGAVKQIVALALLAALAACTPPARSGQTTRDVEAAGPDFIPIIDDTYNLSCNASAQASCTATGCQAEGEGSPLVPVAWSFTGTTGEGELCMATGCVPAFLTALPADTAAPNTGLSGAVLTRPNPDQPTPAPDGDGPFYSGVVTMARDGTAFQFAQLNEGSLTVWSGTCSANP
jgi:hypothetical protein